MEDSKLTSATRMVHRRDDRPDILRYLSIRHNILARQNLFPNKNRAYSARLKQRPCSLQRLDQDFQVGRVGQPAHVDKRSILHAGRRDRHVPAGQRGDERGEDGDVVLRQAQSRRNRVGSDHVFDLWPVGRELGEIG